MAKYKIIPSTRTIVQSPISIGHKAEKGVEAIEFDLTAWVETYGSGTLTVIMRRWGDAIPYPIALEIDENNKATWTLSDTDTAKAGMAYAQLNYIVGDEVVKKSDIYTFRVMDSLVGEGEPPEAYESWLEHLTHFAAEAMAEVLDIEGIVTDKTLTIDGGIADAKATGEALAEKVDAADYRELSNRVGRNTIALAEKADRSTTYTKAQVDQMISDVEVETDTTLSVSGAPADAAETGRQIDLLKADLNYLVSLPYITGYAVSLSQEPVDLNLSSSSNFKRCTIVNCIEGDVFIINATGLTGARAWAILDSSNMIISMADANAVVENLRLVMPAGASKLVVNSTSDAISYKYGKNYLSLSPQNLLDNEKKQLYENIGLKDNLKDLNEDILFKILDCLRNVSWSNNGGEYFVSRLEKECVPEFYHSTRWAYPSQNGKLINGSEIRVDVPNTFEPDLTWPVLAIDTSDRYSKLAVVDRGVIPYIDNNTLDDTQVYPIPVPDGINKITISVSPADIQIHPSLWHYLTTALRYSRKNDEDYGVIGTGYVELNNITRLPDDRMYLCVRFTKEDRSPFEVDNYKINYYIS